MSDVWFITGLILIFFLCLYLFQKNLKNSQSYLGTFFLGVFFLLVGVHTLVGLITKVFFEYKGLMTVKFPFFMFYGVCVYLFLFFGKKRIKRADSSSRQFIRKHLFLPVFCTIAYYGMVLTSSDLYSNNTVKYFHLFNVVEALFIIIYTVKIYSILIVIPIIEQKLRFRLLLINTLLLLIGGLLLSYYYLDKDYFFVHDLWLVFTMLCLIVLLLVVYKEVHSFLNYGELVDVDTEMKDVEGIELESKLSEKESRISSDMVNMKVDKIEEKPKYLKSRLSEELLEEYRKKVDNVVVEQKMYNNPDFSLEILSQETDISKHHLGQLFSTVYDKSFNRFINEYRIDHLIQFLKTNQQEVFSVNDLLAISPFKSRASFFRNFKEITGMPPSDYLNEFYKD